ncbi:acetyl-CoA hydrolase/transferase family protein [Bifidobacterium sp.]|uniref:acetyl-CoA hydrolase/transferase family protein n=1 Tax=Bifidobacterium sp. TaxID=41200 RepID=UPI0025C4BAB4|nr:acetyl-CoA hydrolase/transferase C-terminal domain-containing protein [Bifidobacterium sp.]MCH4209827.1 hypothetical protein [Bifidobacterium sp.]MCI1224556.1 hypothetical protein [Bifidobacterium sp.]
MPTDYERELRDKTIALPQALQQIRSGDRVYASTNTQEPVGFLSALDSIADSVENVSVYSVGFEYPYDFLSDEDAIGHIGTRASFLDGTMRKAHSLHTVDFVPLNLHAWRERSEFNTHANVFVGAASPMDRHGYFRFSLGAGMEPDMALAADTVILEVNPKLPQVAGYTEIHISDVDYVYEYPHAPYERPQAELDDVSLTIGRHVASLVDDGATIQIGVGRITDAAATYLRDKNDLGVHTEMITTSMAQLAELGVVTGKRKTLLPRKIVAGFAIGTNELYDFLDDNPSIFLAPTSFVNDPANIARNYRMTSINTAIQVDLTGQVCSESIGHVQFSGTGGAADFAEGAIRSPGGKSIVALKSTAKNGTISTIQPFLNSGAVVSINRSDVDYVVTEYGVAALKGKTLEARAKALIAIAHPDFRDEMEARRREYQIW